MERRDEFRFRSGGVPLPDQFREPAVGDLARAIHDGLVEGGLSTRAIRKVSCALLAIASQVRNRESDLPRDPGEGWTVVR